MSLDKSDTIKITDMKLGAGSKLSSSSSMGSSITRSDFRTANGNDNFVVFEASVLNVTLSIPEVSVAACIIGGLTSITISS